MVAEITCHNDEDTPNGFQDQEATQDTDGWSYTSTNDHENAKMSAMKSRPRSDKINKKAGGRKCHEWKISLLPKQDDVALLATKVRNIKLASPYQNGLCNDLTGREPSCTPRKHLP